MLTKHPDQYSADELEAWIRHLVDDQVSEGPRLDYKETITLERQPDRLEAAKDISSFANELGGTIVYGIPEDRQSDEIAVPRRPYGMDSIPDLESKLENICVDVIAPRLPEWRVRKVELSEYSAKVVYVVWTPESWVGAHMVSAYGDNRYYHRGQLRAVAMEEHEVRQRYERLRHLLSATEDFLNSPQLLYIGSGFPADGFISHYVVCPLVLSAERVDFTTPEIRRWLEENRYALAAPYAADHAYENWTPSAYGVRARLSGEQYLAEIHRNGAINHWGEAEVSPDDERRHMLFYIGELFGIQGFLQFARRFYEKIQYFAPLRFRVAIENRAGVTLFLNRPKQWFTQSPPPLITHDGNLSIDVTSPSSKLFENLNLILKEIGDKMFQAFGRWEADCFDEQLKLKR